MTDKFIIFNKYKYTIFFLLYDFFLLFNIFLIILESYEV
jgi:hypothetical protein